MRSRNKFCLLIQDKYNRSHNASFCWAAGSNRLKTALSFTWLPIFVFYTYKLGCKSSKAVGVHTPLTSRSIILINPPPLPLTRPKHCLKTFLPTFYEVIKFKKINVPVMNRIIHAFGNNLAAWLTPSYTFLHLIINRKVMVKKKVWEFFNCLSLACKLLSLQQLQF